MLDLSELLVPDAIRFGLAASTRNDALFLLSDIAADCYDVDRALVMESAVEREKLGSTGVGDGVAIPHARLRGLPEPRAVLGVFRPGVDFGAPDVQPADIVALLLSPDEAGADHLKALARISRALRSPDNRTLIRQSTSSDALTSLLLASSEATA